MVTSTDTDTTDAPAQEPVRVTLDLPPRLVADYERLAGEGVYLSRDEGLRAALVSAWRFERATHVRLRLDLGGEPSDEDLGLAPDTDRVD